MLIAYRTWHEANEHETRGRLFRSDRDGAQGTSTGYKATGVRHLRGIYPDLGEVDDEDGWLLCGASNMNTEFGFRTTCFVFDANGNQRRVTPRVEYAIGQLSAAADASANWERLTGRQQDEWYNGPLAPLRKAAQEVVRGAIWQMAQSADGMPSEEETAAFAQQAQRFGRLLQEVRITSWRQWGPSPNEATVKFTHDLDRLWRTLSLDESSAALPAETDAAYYAKERARRGH